MLLLFFSFPKTILSPIVKLRSDLHGRIALLFSALTFDVSIFPSQFQVGSKNKVSRQ